MVSITSSYMVIPSEATPNGSLVLSDSEQINAHTHSLTIYIYRENHKPNLKIHNMIDTMRDSLGKILVHYYPLAGRLRMISGGRFEVDCNSMGVKLLEAESTRALDEYGDFEPNDTISELLPKVDYSEPMEKLPLLLVQLTRFICGGLCVGFVISNVIVDGIAGTLFVDSWAKLAREDNFELVYSSVALEFPIGSLEKDEMPFLNRMTLRSEATLNKALHFDHPEFRPLPLILGNSDTTLEHKKETTLAMMKLTREMVGKLKKRANEFMEGDETVVHRRPYSRYESIAAHIWKSACKARHGYHNQPTVVQIVTGTRNRLKPPLPLNYFGNATHPTVTHTCLSGDIVSKPLSYGAHKIREAIEMVTDEYLRSAFDFIGSQHNVACLRPSFNYLGCVESPFLGNPNLNIWSWMSNMPLYGPDFGWGKPVYMGPGVVKGDGKAFIMPSPIGDESISIAIRLQNAHMEAFKEFFYRDI
ncbi:hydroxycinnamoyl-CoA:piscidic acid hydroxycinnamoyltransferase-like [Gastrolobium bilobum]|uniref:hydroxycinnamoyl-CoA:piscidic acid hydroxycinnamoyltransferase-like n=1 Tax=Gastrolobium bilobum TaxID=150636 RepID=UPI002AB29CF3|nr:hydroxycinnamoyl-CoA:piscidic acid hydroxycinnamoyltransferase-like [Gastrolobium bilobum]